MSDTVIKIEDLSKVYRLGEVGTGTISHDINRWWARVRGKEDPFSTVGQVNDRSKRAEGDYVYALKDINLEVKQGEVLGIIGKNGAGKSTLLKLLSRITTPSSGSIKVRGRIASLLEVGTGMHPEMTGRENIYLNGAIMGMTRKEIAKKFDEIIDFAGCAMYVDTPVKRYSSGMRVRLGFAVAAFLEPEILIVDEVLAVGDAEFQKKAIGKMKDVAEGQGRTVLFVSHNMGAVESLCGSATILENGKLVEYSNDVNAVINRYLSDPLSQGTAFWKKTTKEIYSKYIDLTSMFVFTDSTKKELDSCNARRDDQIHVLVEFDVYEKHPMLEVNCLIRDETGAVVFVTQQTDLDTKDWPNVQVGKNKLMFTIPKNFLNTGEYKIYFRSFLYQKEKIYWEEKYSPYVKFTIQGALSKSPFWYKKRDGLVAPIFTWQNV